MHLVAPSAARLEQLAVHVDEVAAAGAIMKVIDVLSDEQEFTGKLPLQIGERAMRLGQPLPASRFPAFLAIAVAGGALLLLVAIVLPGQWT